MPSNNEIALRQNVADLQAQLAAANVRQAELVAELAKEQDRLDWAIRHGCRYKPGNLRWFTVNCEHSTAVIYPRKAIDKLIAAEAAGGSDAARNIGD